MNIAVILISLSLISGNALAGNFVYRFKVDGRTVIKDQVPPEYVPLGYDVLDKQGRVIKTVRAAPTEAELAEIKAQEAAKKAREDAIKKQRDKDLNLKRLYSNTDDIERARKRKLDEINLVIVELKRRIINVEQRLDKTQLQAANYERKGEEVPADLRIEVANMQNTIRESEKGITEQQKALLQANQEFDALRARFRVLLVYSYGTLDEDVDLERVEKSLGPDIKPPIKP